VVQCAPALVRDVLIIAGEASGDLHGAALAERLCALRPDLSLVGIGGSGMAAAGVRLMERTSGIVGFVEVLRHLPAHVQMFRTVRDRLASGSVSLAILIDYGGFNLRVAAAAKSAGVPVLYYITPQVWASRPGRLETMARVITRAAVILPFEEALLRGHGVNATFVGHPLLDRAQSLPDKAEARRRLGLGADDQVLALFPGSRAQEIARHSRDFVAVARELERRRPGLKVIVGVAPTIELDEGAMPFRLARSASFDVLRAADVALCKSGTTTLEAAIAGCPLVVVYRTNWLTFQIAKRIVNIGQIGLVNVVAGRVVAPEFVQDEFVPVRVADALDKLFDPASSERQAMLAGLSEVRGKLGEPGASRRVAQMASDMAP
jgi:lipid-A-disaccharide synthase